MMALISIIVGFTIDNFFSLNNFNVLMGNTTIRFLIALGVSGCLITKGTDLSAGRQAALAATLTGVMVQRADYASRMFSWMPEMNMWVVLLIVLAVGAVLGTVTGSIIAYLKVPPFIATLGIQTIVYGFNLIYTNAQPIGGFSQPFKDFFNWKVFAFGDFKGFSGYILFALFFGVLFWFLYNKTTHGKYMYAIGGNENAAEVSGVNVRKSLTTIYMIAGMMYAFAGFLMTLLSLMAGRALRGMLRTADYKGMIFSCVLDPNTCTILPNNKIIDNRRHINVFFITISFRFVNCYEL